METQKKIVCIMGPTASGKTQLAIDLLQTFPFEIISVDSALVYKGMDIGTAKPSAELLRKAPHRLIDIRDPADAYSAAQFREDALKEISEIFSKGKIPLLVGGTMLYFKALQKGLSDLPSAHEEVRNKILARAEKEGWGALHEELKQFDPAAAARIHAHDTQRIQRAFEVFEVSGKNITSWQNQQKDAFPFDVINIALAPNERSVLHDRIEKRFKEMLTQGFLEEVKNLQQRKELSLDTPSIRSVGYRQAWEHLQGDFSHEEMTEKAIAATRQFAKRQLTWLRHWPFPIEWFDSVDPNLVQHVTEFLKNQL